MPGVQRAELAAKQLFALLRDGKRIQHGFYNRDLDRINDGGCGLVEQRYRWRSDVSFEGVERALEWVTRLREEDSPLNERERTIAYQILKEIHARLTFLRDVGLDYLTLDRKTGSLAGGEAQRGPALVSPRIFRLRVQKVPRR